MCTKWRPGRSHFGQEPGKSRRFHLANISYYHLGPVTAGTGTENTMYRVVSGAVFALVLGSCHMVPRPARRVTEGIIRLFDAD
jgi:hypothetical protein